jgi:DNA-3-methyladenine glycosylase I
MSNELTTYYIRPLTTIDRNWVADFLDQHWQSTKIVALGQVYYGHLLPGFAAIPGAPDDPKPAKAIGLVTFRIDENGDCHIMTLNSTLENKGVGAALLGAVRVAAAEAGCKKLWLVTTNDNLRALRFYQKRGFALSRLHADSLNEARRLKPQIPLIGLDNIPLRDELVLESAI